MSREFFSQSPAFPPRRSPAPYSGFGGNVSFKIMVPVYAVGGILGSKGQMLQELMAETGANIHIQQKSELEKGAMLRGITFKGTWEETLRAQDRVLDMVREVDEKHALSNENPFTEYVVLTGDKVGNLIGKGGETIAQVQSKTSTIIRVYHGHNMDENYALAVVRGPEQRCINEALVEFRVLLEVDQLLSDVPSPAFYQQQNESSMDAEGGDHPAHDEDGFPNATPLPCITSVVEKQFAGHIIGREAVTIKRIQGETGTNIRLFPDRYDIQVPSTVMRIMKIQGPDCDSVAEAFQQVQDIVQNAKEEIANAVANGDESMMNKKVTLAVPEHQLGLIIGKGGRAIREIQQSTGAKINLNESRQSNHHHQHGRGGGYPRDRCVTISGSPACVDEAEKLLVNKINSSNMNERGGHYQQAFNSNMRGGGQGMYGGGVNMGGNGGHYNNSSPFNTRGGGGGNGGNNGMYGAPPPTHHRPGLAITREMREIALANELVGAIIGPRGSVIRRIQQTSGAKVTVAPLQQGKPDRLVSIYGEHDQVTMACDLVQSELERATKGLPPQQGMGM